MSLSFLEKGRAIGVNVGRELIILANTVSGAPWVEKYSWGKPILERLSTTFATNGRNDHVYTTFTTRRFQFL